MAYLSYMKRASDRRGMKTFLGDLERGDASILKAMASPLRICCKGTISNATPSESPGNFSPSQQPNTERCDYELRPTIDLSMIPTLVRVCASLRCDSSASANEDRATFGP